MFARGSGTDGEVGKAGVRRVQRELASSIVGCGWIGRKCWQRELLGGTGWGQRRWKQTAYPLQQIAKIRRNLGSEKCGANVEVRERNPMVVDQVGAETSKDALCVKKHIRDLSACKWL